MKKVKLIYLLIALIALITSGILISVPEFIPSLQIVPLICVLVIYVLCIALLYLIIALVHQSFQEKFAPGKADSLTKLFAFTTISGLFVTFIITSLNITQGFQNRILAKKLEFPKYKVTLYVFDNSLKSPLTALKVKDKVLPILHDVTFLENQIPSGIKSRMIGDTIVFSGSNIEVKYNLRERKVWKHYTEKSDLPDRKLQ